MGRYTAACSVPGSSSSRTRMDRVKETVSFAPRSASASGQARQQVLQAAGASPKGSQRSPAQGAAPSQISAGDRASRFAETAAGPADPAGRQAEQQMAIFPHRRG